MVANPQCPTQTSFLVCWELVTHETTSGLKKPENVVVYSPVCFFLELLGFLDLDHFGIVKERKEKHIPRVD